MQKFLLVTAIAMVSCVSLSFAQEKHDATFLPPEEASQNEKMMINDEMIDLDDGMIENEMMDDEIIDPDEEINYEEELLQGEEAMMQSLETQIFERRSALRDRQSDIQQMRKQWNQFSQKEKGNRIQEYRNQYGYSRNGGRDMMNMSNRGTDSFGFGRMDRSFSQGKNFSFQKNMGTKNGKNLNSFHKRSGKNWGILLLTKFCVLVFGLAFVFGSSFLIRKGWDMAGKRKV